MASPNKGLLVVGILILIVGVAQWVVITQLEFVLSASISNPDGSPILTTNAIDPGTTATITDYESAIFNNFYIPALLIPYFRLYIGLQGNEFNSEQSIDQVNITITTIIDGNPTVLAEVRAVDYISSISADSGTIFVDITLLDDPRPSVYGITIKNGEDKPITVHIYRIGTKTDTRNVMIISALVGILMVVVSFVMGGRAAGPRRRRKAFVDFEEEPILGPSSSGIGTVSKKKKKKKKKSGVTGKKKKRVVRAAAESTCQYCGQSIPPNSFFCPHCYAELR